MKGSVIISILHINSNFFESSVYKNLYAKLDEYKVKQKIFVSLKKGKNIKKGSLFLENGEYIYSYNYNNIDRYIYISKISKIYSDIIQKVSFGNIKLIHAHSLFTNGDIARKIKKEKNIDFIVAVRSYDIDFILKYAIHLRKRAIKILNSAKKIIFISPAYRKRLFDKYIPYKYYKELEEKSIVVPNGINEYWLNNRYHTKSLNSTNKLKLLYVGKFIKRKNIDKILEVGEEMGKKGYEISLKLVGRGKIKNKIKRKANNSSVEVNIIDYIPHEELIQLYRNSDIFIMPSRRETFGLVYIEAISQGLPIIYSKDEGVDGYFKNKKVGVSVNINNITDIISKIENLLKNYNEFSKNAINECDRFSWDRIAKKYIEIYNNL